MQLKEEFRSYDALRLEHDAQIVQIAMEAGLRISPEQWSSLLYGDATHKSHMQSIIDKVGRFIFLTRMKECVMINGSLSNVLGGQLYGRLGMAKTLTLQFPQKLPTVIKVRLCLMLLLIELYMFISLSHHGHISRSQQYQFN